MRKYQLLLMRTCIGVVLFCLPVSALGADKVTLQLKWFHQFQFAGYYAAKEKGFYAAEGLDVVFRQRDIKTSYIDDVLEGKAEYGTSDAGLLFSRLQEKPLVVLAQIFQHSPLVLLTLKESGLRTPHQLAGKKVMIDTIGFSDAPANGMLFKALGGFEQFQPVQMTFRYEDLSEKKVDAVVAYVTDQPFKFQEVGVEVNIIDPRDYGVDFYGDNLFTTEKEIREHPQRVEKMIRATLKGWHYALQHKDEIVELILKKYNPQKLSREHLLYEAEQTEKMIVPNFIELGSYEPSRFIKITEIYVALGLTDNTRVDQAFLYTPSKSLIDLTAEEQSWLVEHPVIRVRVGKWPPFHFMDGAKPKGLAIDYITTILNELGLKIEFVPLLWDEALESISKLEKIDLLPTIAWSKERAERINITSKYLSFPFVIFTRRDHPSIESLDDLAGKKVVVENDYITHTRLKADHPEIELLLVKTTQAALEALSFGEADAYVGNLAVGSYLIENLGLQNLKVAARTDYATDNQSIGIRKDWPELAGMIEKALKAFTEDEHRKIRNRWLAMEPASEDLYTIDLTSKERAFLKEHPVIRVHNEKDWPPFNYFEYGRPRGLSIDYMDLVAEKLGIEVEYVTGPSWNEFLGMIKRKELDVMLNIVKTEDRMKYLLYTEPYVKNPNTIVSSQKNPYETMQALFGKTVAFPKGFFYEEVLTKSFPQIKRLPVENTLASLKAVTFGRADAALGEEAVVRTLINNNFLSGLRISGEVEIGDLDLTNLRLGVRNDWQLLQSALMKAMAAVAPEEITQIWRKWLTRATEKKDRIPLTDAERKWLAGHRNIRLGVDPAWPPFEFIDKSGNYAGIGSGFIEALSDRLNIKMTPIPGLSWSQVIEKAKAGEIDVLPAVTRTSERDKYLNFTKPYLSFPVVTAINKKIPFIGSIKDLEGYRVGVVKDYYTEDILRNDHPYLTLVTFPTMEEALQKLDEGLIDAFVGNMITITQEIARSGLENTRISASTEYTFELSLGVQKDLPELIGILNKAIDDISSREKAAITSTWMSDVEVKIRLDLKAILAWAIPIGGSIFLIIAFVVVWNRKLGREITERKRTEAQLRKLSSATENSPASVVVSDRNGIIEYVNPTFCEVTGYSAEEAIGNNPRVLKSGDLPDSFYEDLWNTILSGNVWEGDFINLKKNGEEFWESASISPIKDDAGEITHFVAVKQDITERKQMEQEILIAKEKAEDATKAKGDFLANMSHEIRTPMNAIIGMAHLALKTELTPKQQDYLNKIQSSANSLLGIINDILDFSKIEAGKLDMESLEFNLDDVLDNLANLVTVKAQEKEDLEVLFDTGQEVPRFLVGDPLRLGQVLINLANNAVKFTDSGEIVVSTELLKQDEAGLALKFSVRDTGIGLTEEQIGKLFQSFSQADTSTTRKFGGTGLGLTISKRLVEMVGGEIWVESEPGQGTTFSFTANFGIGKDKVKKRLVPSSALRGMKVLVVDDSATSRTILQDILESFSFEVTLAVSAERGLEEIQRADTDQPYELVLMDWKMPGMNGLEASERIKNHQTLSKIPAIILVTAYGREEIMQQAEKIGLEGFLMKPIGPSVLFDTIMHAFGEGITKTTRMSDRKGKPENLKTLQGAQILLVEDNEINQQVAREILQGAGLNVTVANDGQEAVNAVKESNYDAVLMDIQMPVMDGYTASREIRKWEEKLKAQSSKLKAKKEMKAQGSRLKKMDSEELSAVRFQPSARAKRVPIIAMTAHAMAGDEQKSLQAGMNDHVTKPIDPDKLFATLQKWIKPVAERAAVLQRLPASEGPPVPEAPPQPDQALPDEELLPESLPGFDLTAGLARLMGNKRLYRKLLVDFGSNYTATAIEIHQALDKKDFEQVHSLVHNLKGLAGNLEATDLQAAAVKMEKLVKGQSEETVSEKELEKKIAELRDALSRALDAVQTLGRPAEKKSIEDRGDGVSSVSLRLPKGSIDRIKVAAEMGDVMQIQSIANELRSANDAMVPYCDKLIQLAEDFDFDGIQNFVGEFDS